MGPSKLLSLLILLLSILSCSQIQADTESILGKVNRLIEEDKYPEAIKLLKSPELVRNGEAQFSLYVAYEYGKGVGIDKSEALHRLLISAYLGYPPAVEAMSIFADHGTLKIQRNGTAKKFWEDEYYRLVDQSDPESEL